MFLSELFGNLSFFLIFLLYPGSSSKIFKAFFCVGFDGEGEDGQQFLRADFSINCASTEYVVLRAYAIVMLFIYPVGGRRP